MKALLVVASLLVPRRYQVLRGYETAGHAGH